MKKLTVKQNQNIIEFILENKEKLNASTISTMDDSLFDGLKIDFFREAEQKKTALYSAEVNGEKYVLSVVSNMDLKASRKGNKVYHHVIDELSDSCGKPVYNPRLKFIKHSYSLEKEEISGEKE